MNRLPPLGGAGTRWGREGRQFTVIVMVAEDRFSVKGPTAIFSFFKFWEHRRKSIGNEDAVEVVSDRKLAKENGPQRTVPNLRLSSEPVIIHALGSAN